MAKICMLAFSYYATDSRLRRETEALTSRGDEVDVICLREPKKEAVARSYSGVRLFPLAVGKYRGDSNTMYLANYLSFFVLAFFLIALLYFRKRYDIIQVHTMPDFLVFAALVPKLFGVKVALDVHELMPELYISKFGLDQYHPFVRLITWVERRSIDFADKAIAVHIPHRDILVKHGNPEEKFSVLLNLPDPIIFSGAQCSQRQGGDRFRLIYHGTIARRHGLEVAFRALTVARGRIPVLEFYVMGEGDDLVRLIGLVEDLDLGDCVKFSDGRVPLEEIPSQIKQADLGIVPMVHDSFTRYMLPVKLMEYVKLGIPVIASRTDTMEAYFDETMVRYFQPGRDVELAHHIVDLYENPQKRKLLALNADRFNRQYSWENQKREYHDVIDYMLSEQSLGNGH